LNSYSFQNAFNHNYCSKISVHKVNDQDKQQIQTCLLDVSFEEHKTSQATPSEILDNQPRYDDYDDDVDFHKQHEEYISLLSLTKFPIVNPLMLVMKRLSMKTID
jgi:hypothetical protein